jgi:oxygen-dependent protoporphyrinogen oxidase
VYAGDPKQLSVAAAFPKLYELEQTYGSVLRGAVAGRKERKRREKRGEISKQSARLFSFDRGLSTLTEAIAQRLGPKILLNSKATAIIALDGRSGRGRYEVSFTQGQDVGTLEVDAVVLSSPAYAASRLIRGMDGVLAEGMEKVIYPPVSMVFLGYESSRIRKLPDGFGFLVPEVENRKILGTIWSSSIFPGRAPTGCVAFTTFVGGSRQPHLGLGPEEELLENVKNELDYFHGIRGEPACEVVKTWKLSIPQYVVGYTDFLGRLDKFEKNHPGFFFCANFRGGIALGDCIKNAGQTLSKVQEYLA